MCGICGYLATKRGTGKQAKAVMHRLLVASQVRGTDAAGIAYVNHDGLLNVVKQPGRAADLVDGKAYKYCLTHNNPDVMIGHTRAKTQGDAKDNNNNHPLHTPGGLALVHNGIIHNEAALFAKYKLPRTGEVDSEIIIRLIEHYHRTERKSMVNAIKAAADEISGGMACAMIDKTAPDKLYLWASDNPLALAYEHDTGVVYFGSTPDILETSLIQYKYVFGLFPRAINKENYTIVTVSENTGIVFTIGQKTTTMSETFLLDRPVTTYGQGYIYGGGEQWGGSYYSGRQRAMFSQPDKKLHHDDPKVRIKRPSMYDDESLTEREKVLSELKLNGAIHKKERHELAAITNTLNGRLKKRISVSDSTPIIGEDTTPFTQDDIIHGKVLEGDNKGTDIVLSGRDQYND